MKLQTNSIVFIAQFIIFIKITCANYILIPNIFNKNILLLGLMLFSIALSFWIVLLPKSKRLKAIIAVDLIISIFVISDIIYYRYFNDLCSIRMAVHIGQIFNVKDSLKSLFRLSDILFFIDILFLMLLYFLSRDKAVEKNKWNQKDIFRGKKIVLTVSLISAAILFNYMNIKGFDKKNPNALKSMWDKTYIVSEIGTVNYHIVDAIDFFSEKFKRESITDNEKENIAKWLSDKNNISKNIGFGLAKNKNLVIIQVEALQDFVINRSINNTDVTPNLNSLIKESMYFSNVYGQTSGGNTSDAEFLVNTSLYPVSEGAAFVRFAHNEYNSLAKILKNNGYEKSVAMHAYKPGFWNRQSMYAALGIDRFYSSKDFNFNEHIGLGLSDRSFFKQSIDVLRDLETPFFASLITLTSHYPYNNVDKYGDFNVGEIEGSLLANYIKSIHYADEQIGFFIQQLKDTELWDQSLVVIYGDHPGIPFNNREELRGFLKLDDKQWLWEKLQKVPLIIHLPESKVVGEYEIAAGQADILPTICNLLGIQADTVFGLDLFNAEDGFVVFRDGSFITNNYYYMSNQDSAYDIINGQKLDNKIFEDKVQLAKIHLSYSDKIINHNLLPFINKYMLRK